jgi:hypothetical protein
MIDLKDRFQQCKANRNVFVGPAERSPLTIHHAILNRFQGGINSPSDIAARGASVATRIRRPSLLLEPVSRHALLGGVIFVRQKLAGHEEPNAVAFRVCKSVKFEVKVDRRRTSARFSARQFFQNLLSLRALPASGCSVRFGWAAKDWTS